MNNLVALFLCANLFVSVDPAYRKTDMRLKAFECKVWDDRALTTRDKMDLYQFFSIIEKENEPEKLKEKWAKYCGFQRGWLRKKAKDGKTVQQHIERTARHYKINLV